MVLEQEAIILEKVKLSAYLHSYTKINSKCIKN